MSTTFSSHRARSASCLLAVLFVASGCSSESATVGASSAPCPPLARGISVIDWVPFVVVDGQMYATKYGEPEWVAEENQVGDVIAVVSCRIAEVGDPDFVPRDGDAAYLPAGTEIHRVQGRSPDEALTALEEGTWRIFQATDD